MGALTNYSSVTPHIGLKLEKTVPQNYILHDAYVLDAKINL